jgi:hypothetical protein
MHVIDPSKVPAKKIRLGHFNNKTETEERAAIANETLLSHQCIGKAELRNYFTSKLAGRSNKRITFRDVKQFTRDIGHRVVKTPHKRLRRTNVREGISYYDIKPRNRDPEWYDYESSSGESLNPDEDDDEHGAQGEVASAAEDSDYEPEESSEEDVARCSSKVQFSPEKQPVHLAIQSKGLYRRYKKGEVFEQFYQLLMKNVEGGSKTNSQRLKQQQRTAYNNIRCFAHYVMTDNLTKRHRPAFDVCQFVQKAHEHRAVQHWVTALEDCEMTEVTLKGRLNAIQRFASFCQQRIPARKLGAFAPFCESMKKAAEDLRAAVQKRETKTKRETTKPALKCSEAAKIFNYKEEKGYNEWFVYILGEPEYFDNEDQPDYEDLVYNLDWEEFRKCYRFLVGSILAIFCIDHGQRPDVATKMKLKEFEAAVKSRRKLNGKPVTYHILEMSEHKTSGIKSACLALSDEQMSLLQVYADHYRRLIKPRIELDAKGKEKDEFFLLNFAGSTLAGHQSDWWQTFQKLIKAEFIFPLRFARTAIGSLIESLLFVSDKQELEMLASYMNHSRETRKKHYDRGLVDFSVRGSALIEKVKRKAMRSSPEVEVNLVVESEDEDAVGGEQVEGEQEEEMEKEQEEEEEVDEGYAERPEEEAAKEAQEKEAMPSRTGQPEGAKRRGAYVGGTFAAHPFNYKEYDEKYGLHWKKARSIQPSETLKKFLTDQHYWSPDNPDCKKNVASLRNQLNRMIRLSFAEDMAKLTDSDDSERMRRVFKQYGSGFFEAQSVSSKADIEESTIRMRKARASSSASSAPLNQDGDTQASPSSRLQADDEGGEHDTPPSAPRKTKKGSRAVPSPVKETPIDRNVRMAEAKIPGQLFNDKLEVRESFVIPSEDATLERVSIGDGVYIKKGIEKIEKGMFICDYPFDDYYSTDDYDKKLEENGELFGDYAQQYSYEANLKTKSAQHGTKWTPPSGQHFPGKLMVVVASKETAGYGHKINHTPHRNCANVERYVYLVNGFPMLVFVAKNDIQPGDELLTQYGGDYQWRDAQPVCPRCSAEVDQSRMKFTPLCSEAELERVRNLLGITSYDAREPLPSEPSRCRWVPLNAEPTATIDVNGDGNCFYRSVSVYITGNETQHAKLREQLHNFVKGQDNWMMFPSANAYKRALKRLATPGEWAHENEIFAMAAYLGITIAVWVEDRKEWQHHQPRLWDNPTKETIYLKNEGRYHFVTVDNVKSFE